MLPNRQSLSVPIHTGYVAKLSSAPTFGTSPFGMRGLDACDCGPRGGCGCSGGGMSGLGATSLDSLISQAFGWASGAITASLPASASVPPQYGSTGAISTQIQAYLPWIIGGYLLYRAMK